MNGCCLWDRKLIYRLGTPRGTISFAANEALQITGELGLIPASIAGMFSESVKRHIHHHYYDSKRRQWNTQ